MLFHIGAEYLLRDKEIIGCFDIDGHSDSEINREFLKKSQKSGVTDAAGYDLPRSFIVTDDKVVLTHISTAGLKGRFSSKNNLK